MCCVVLAAAPASANAWLELDRQALLQGEWWRLWSGHMVHFSTRHALINAGLVALLGSIAECLLGTRRLLIVLAAGSAFVSLSLAWAVPALSVYRGTSGVATLLACAICVIVWNTTPALRKAVVPASVILLTKTMLESTGLHGGFSVLPDDVAVAWQAHAAGILAGLLAGSINSLMSPARE